MAPATSRSYAPADNADLLFQPKALLVMASGDNEDWQTGAATVSIGWATTTSDERSSRAYVEVGTLTWDGTDYSGNLAGGMGASSGLASFDPYGFSLSSMNAGGPDFWFMALGGADLQAYAGSFQITATGSVSVTGVGFQPDMLLSNNAPQDEVWAFGCATSATDQAAASQCQRQGIRYAEQFYSGSFATAFRPNFFTPTTADQEYRVSITSIDSDGFTVNVDAITGGPFTIGFLALRSPSTNFKVGIETQKTSTGTKATTGVGFQPGAGLFCGTDRTATTGTDAGGDAGPWGAMSVGWTSGVAGASGNLAAAGKYASGGHRFAMRGLSNVVLQAIEPTSGTPTENAIAALDSFDSDGFTLDWTTADATARYFMYALWETAPASVFIPQIYRTVRF